MKTADLIQQAEDYDKSDWSFSSTFLWEKIIKDHPSPNHLFQYAAQLRLSGDYVKAEEMLNKIDLQIIPNQHKFTVYVMYGQLYEDQGKMEEASEAYQKSIECGTTETYPYLFLAAVLSKKSQLKKVEQILLEALHKNGNLDEVYYNLSTNYARQGNFKVAYQMMEKCLKIDPSYPRAMVFLEDFENILHLKQEIVKS